MRQQPERLDSLDSLESIATAKFMRFRLFLLLWVNRRPWDRGDGGRIRPDVADVPGTSHDDVPSCSMGGVLSTVLTVLVLYVR
jgi:hypothetical protein